MTAATALPPAPAADDVQAGWWRRPRSRAETVHRLTAGETSNSAWTVCGLMADDPQPVEPGSGPVRACETCRARVADRDRPNFRTRRTRGAASVPRVLAAPLPRTPEPRPSASVVDGDPLVVLMASPGYDLAGLLAEHGDDRHGRCPSCGGPQSGRVRYPCDLRRAAVRAAELRRTRGGTA